MDKTPEVKADSVREDVSWISGEYLTHACHLLALQITDGNEEDKAWTADDMPEFKERMTYLMRQHAPIAYAYFFDVSKGEDIIPQGTIDVIIEIIRRQIPEFIGGRKSSGLIIPEGFRS